MKFPSKSQWRQFFKILSKLEKIIFFIFLFLFFSSAIFLSASFYLKYTKIIPAEDGFFTEGAIGQPRFINPILASSNDIDRDLVELIFSGLMKYDAKGEIIPDLAKSYEIKAEGKVYELYLKENLFWSDGEILDADDLIFTIKTIQNSDYNSPIRASWLGVEVEKVSDLGIRFKLKNPYSAFLESLTLKIIPEHIWKDIPPQNFPLAIYNLKPVGSGPYKLKNLIQNQQGRIISLDLVRNQRYFGKKPYLSQISFQFFDSETELIKSYRKGEIKGFSLTSLKNLPKSLDGRWVGCSLYSFSLPRYFAVFFNPDKSKILADLNLRRALNYGTNKEEIIEKLLEGKGRIVHSPILPEIYGFNPPSKIYQFDIEKAKEFLEKADFVEIETGQWAKIIKREPVFQFKSDLRYGSKEKEVKELQKCLANPPAGGPEVYPEGEITGYFGRKTKQAVIRFQEKYRKDILKPWGFKQGTGLVSKTTRQKLNEVCFLPLKEILPLKFSLVTVDQPVLVEVANLLKNQWAELGVEIEIKTFDISQLEKDIIKPRDYQSLLFGEVLGAIPDPYPFWHSNQKKDPGLNLAIYENKKTDKLLEEARKSLNETERKEKLEKFQDFLIEDAPAVFLYNPDYLYFVSKDYHPLTPPKEATPTEGRLSNLKMIVDPSKRFSNIENWYIKEKRVWR